MAAVARAGKRTGACPGAGGDAVSCGVDSIAVDPSNKHVVFLTMNAARPEMLKSDRLPSGGNVYKSTDGGINVHARKSVRSSLEPNGPRRTEGERLKVDPNNGQVDFLRQPERRSLAQPGRRHGSGTSCKGTVRQLPRTYVLRRTHRYARAAPPYEDVPEVFGTIFAVMPRKAQCS